MDKGLHGDGTSHLNGHAASFEGEGGWGQGRKLVEDDTVVVMEVMDGLHDMVGNDVLVTDDMDDALAIRILRMMHWSCGVGWGSRHACRCLSTLCVGA